VNARMATRPATVFEINRLALHEEDSLREAK
jgi:hypothetical protein